MGKILLNLNLLLEIILLRYLLFHNNITTFNVTNFEKQG